MSVLGGRRVAALCALFALGLTACESSDKPNYSSNPPVPSTPVMTPTPTDTITQNSPSATSVPPSTPATSVPTSGPNVSPGEQPPTLSAGGKVDADTGAVAFAYYWIETLDWGYATESSALARTAFAPSCTDCAKFMGNFDEAEASHLRFVGGRFTILNSLLTTNDHTNGASFAVDVTFNVAALKTYDASGKLVDSEPAYSNITYRNWLAWSNDHWQVVACKEVTR